MSILCFRLLVGSPPLLLGSLPGSRLDHHPGIRVRNHRLKMFGSSLFCFFTDRAVRSLARRTEPQSLAPPLLPLCLRNHRHHFSVLESPTPATLPATMTTTAVASPPSPPDAGSATPSSSLASQSSKPRYQQHHRHPQHHDRRLTPTMPLPTPSNTIPTPIAPLQRQQNQQH